MLAHVLSFVDRQILNLLVGPIRKDLGISDTEMSLLMGLSFAFFYTICGIPLARWADRGSRRWLIAGGAFAWSLATAACGLAQRYSHMLLARVGVGVGEATLSPASFSLITDYFPREQRASAISIFVMGVYLGGGLAFLIGGIVATYAATHGAMTLPLIGEIRTWQVIFLILGAVGVLFSLMLLLVREPPRSSPGSTGIPIREVLAKLKSNRRTLTCHHLGFAVISLAGYGSSAWIPSFYIRVHHWTPYEVGLTYGVILMVFGALGVNFGGRIADYYLRRGVTDACMRVGMWAAILAVPSSLSFLTFESYWGIFAALAAGTFFFSMPFGCAPAALQEIVPANMRAQTSAIYLFVINMIGLGLGPTAVALVTDYVFHDDQAVGQSLMLINVSSLIIAAILLGLGLKPYRESLARQRAAEA
ncbi:MAG: MFS transporter [Pseudomonadota bacterium]